MQQPPTEIEECSTVIRSSFQVQKSKSINAARNTMTLEQWSRIEHVIVNMPINIWWSANALSKSTSPKWYILLTWLSWASLIYPRCLYIIPYLRILTSSLCNFLHRLVTCSCIVPNILLSSFSSNTVNPILNFITNIILIYYSQVLETYYIPKELISFSFIVIFHASW
jgi:hypothetical protein